jgi:hypothetical protein
MYAFFQYVESEKLGVLVLENGCFGFYGFADKIE